MARKSPTEKQKRFAHKFIQSGNATQSALEVYNAQDETSAGVIGYKNMNNPAVLSYISEVLDKNGLSDDYISAKVKIILDKSVTKQSLKKTQPSDGIRIAEMLFRLKDRFPAERKVTTTQSLRLTLQGNSVDELKIKLNKVLEQAKLYKSLLK